FFLARRCAPSPGHDRTVTNFVWAALLILVVEELTAHLYPATIIVQSHIIRAGVFIIVFAYLYCAHAIVKRYQSGEFGRFDFTLLVGALTLSIIPCLLLIAWFLERLIASVRWRRLATAVIVPATFIVTLIGVYQARLWQPGVHIFAQPSPWYD